MEKTTKSTTEHPPVNRHDTPRKTHVIKFRVTEKEKLELNLCCKLLHLSRSRLIRQALQNVRIKRTVVVSGGGKDALPALSTLLAQCSRVGSNLNQLARYFNSGGTDTQQLRAQILEELSALTTFRLNAEQMIGELYGNHQAFEL